MMDNSDMHIYRKLDQSVDKLFQEAVVSHNVVKKYKRSLSRSKPTLTTALSDTVSGSKEKPTLKSTFSSVSHLSQTYYSSMHSSENPGSAQSVNSTALECGLGSFGTVANSDENKNSVCKLPAIESSKSIVPNLSVTCPFSSELSTASTLSFPPSSSTLHTTGSKNKEVPENVDLLRTAAVLHQAQIKIDQAKVAFSEGITGTSDQNKKADNCCDNHLEFPNYVHMETVKRSPDLQLNKCSAESRNLKQNLCEIPSTCSDIGQIVLEQCIGDHIHDIIKELLSSVRSTDGDKITSSFNTESGSVNSLSVPDGHHIKTISYVPQTDHADDTIINGLVKTSHTENSELLNVADCAILPVLHTVDQDITDLPRKVANQETILPGEIIISSKNSSGDSDQDSVESGVTSVRRGSEVKAGSSDVACVLRTSVVNNERRYVKPRRKQKLISFNKSTTEKSALKRIANQQKIKKRQKNVTKKGEQSLKKMDGHIYQTSYRSLDHPSRTCREQVRCMPNSKITNCQKAQKRKRDKSDDFISNVNDTACLTEVSVLEEHKKSLLDEGSNSVGALAKLEENAQLFLQTPPCLIAVDAAVKKWSDGAHTFRFLESLVNQSHVGGVWKSIVQED